MSKYCNKVVVLKSVSVSVEAFDAEGKPLRGIRRGTTIQVASFEHSERILHQEISESKAQEFEAWRATQLVRIEKAFIENAAAGKLGGVPLLKTRNEIGNPKYKVGEFSGVITSLIDVQPGMIKNVMNGRVQEPRPVGSVSSTADFGDSKYLISRFLEITEGVIRYQNLTGKKGDDLFTLDRLLDIRAAWMSCGKLMENDFAGQGKVEGERNGRNAASEGRALFIDLKRRINE